jgi:hypothetical protein
METEIKSKINPILKIILTEILDEITRSTASQCCSIRLEENGDYPFYINRGYPEFFIKEDNSILSVEKKSYKELVCMCGNIIKGRININFPFFTKYGSFWTNNLTNLLAKLSKEQKEFIGPLRSICTQSGYESLAIIPLKSGKKNLGLIHLSDPLENYFDKKMVLKIENLSKDFSEIINYSYKIIKKLSIINKKRKIK